MNPTQHRSVHAAAVGHGVAWAIYATAEGPRTPEEWVRLCMTAADEAEAAAADEPESEGEGSAIIRGFLESTREPGHRPTSEIMGDVSGRRTIAMIEAGAAAFTACMPQLTGRRSAQAYIACVAVGLQRRYFTGGEAKAMLYTVQLALSAHPSRRAKPRQHKGGNQ